MIAEKLKACPFCGRMMKIGTIPDPDFEIQVIGHDEAAQIVCPIMNGIAWFGTREAAVQLWNRRADDGQMQRLRR